MNFEVIYRDVSVSVGSGGVASNVNINASNGDALTDTDGALNVNISNLLASPVQSQLVLDVGGTPQLASGILAQDAVYSLNVFSGRLQTNTADGLIAQPANPATTYPFELVNVGCKQICVFGQATTLTGGGTTPCNITIRYSLDGTTFFDSSLGVISLTTEGQQFSRDWVSAAKWVGFKCDTAATVIFNVSACQ